MKLQEKFIKNVNSVLLNVDFERLDNSCNGKDKTYAKEVLEQMHNAFVSVYGDGMIYGEGVEFIQLPAVICGSASGHVALGIVTIDLQSSGEHWGTFFLTPHGVLDQGSKNLDADKKEYIRKEFIPYDYWYTPKVYGDIHVDFNNIPNEVQELMQFSEEMMGQTEDEIGMNL